MSKTAPAVTFDIIGDAYVDLFCFLGGNAWPEHGGDARLVQPIRSYAGGSALNTATHLAAAVAAASSSFQIVLQTVLNPEDDYGQLLLRHAQQHHIPLINCQGANPDSPSASASSATSATSASTGHCIVIVSKEERTFMSHPGCVEHFSAAAIQVEQIIQTDGPVHVHVAGYYDTSGFWHGQLAERLRYIRKHRDEPTTTISLVPQHDASNQWDGGLEEVIPLLDFLILNEMEADRIVARAKQPSPDSKLMDDSHDEYAGRCEEWCRFFNSISPRTCIVVTRGSQGAIALRNGKVLARLCPAVEVTVLDPTGAGDAFIAGFLNGIWSHKQQQLESHGDHHHHHHHHQESTATDTEGNVEACNEEYKEELWSTRSIQQGLKWGCAIGTATVTMAGASIPPNPEVVLDIYQRQPTISK